jgi:AmmeMemoRadiSam system protein A
MSSGEPPTLSTALRRVLTDVARGSIESGLRGVEPRVVPTDHPLPLQELRASFVTLQRNGELRGCIGALEAELPLVEDVARSAHGAAFRDPRFKPLQRDEFVQIEIHISVLSPLAPLHLSSREELIAALRPKVDGLLLRQGPCRGTFLPSVWESLPHPTDFLRELERKAGLDADAWSRPVECFRYTTEEWGA